MQFKFIKFEFSYWFKRTIGFGNIIVYKGICSKMHWTNLKYNKPE